jgi:hypothetical protein
MSGLYGKGGEDGEDGERDDGNDVLVKVVKEVMLVKVVKTVMLVKVVIVMKMAKLLMKAKFAARTILSFRRIDRSPARGSSLHAGRRWRACYLGLSKCPRPIWGGGACPAQWWC